MVYSYIGESLDLRLPPFMLKEVNGTVAHVRNVVDVWKFVYTCIFLKRVSVHTPWAGGRPG